ncbi:MAG: hypothetical protein ACJ8KC_03475 [Candidatus Udaeobacter sp.]
MGHADPKVFGLLDQTLWTADAPRFRRINKIKSDEIFGVIRPNMEAVAVVAVAWDELTVVERDPIFGSVSCAKADSRRAKESNSNKRAYTDSREDRKAKDQTVTSNWLMILTT